MHLFHTRTKILSDDPDSYVHNIAHNTSGTFMDIDNLVSFWYVCYDEYYVSTLVLFLLRDIKNTKYYISTLVPETHGSCVLWVCIFLSIHNDLQGPWHRFYMVFTWPYLDTWLSLGSRCLVYYRDVKRTLLYWKKLACQLCGIDLDARLLIKSITRFLTLEL